MIIDLNTFFSSNSLVSFISILGILGTGVFFLMYANKKEILNPSLDQYLLADRKINKKDFAGSFTASGISLGGWIIYFISCHKIYGWLMLIGPVFYVITNIIFLMVLKKINPIQMNYRTVSELWFAVFPCKFIAKCISIMSAMACLFLFFVEVHVGSAILYILFPKYVLFKHLSFFFIGLTVLAYAYRGGYLTVVKTDGLQLILICGASLALCILAIYIPTQDGYSHNMINRLFTYQQPDDLVGIFVAWVIMNNICGCLVEPTALQRINAAKDVKEAFLGLLRSLWRFVLLLSILLFSFMLIYVKGYDYNNLEEFLYIVENQTGIFKFIIYPVIVVGFSAALFSTADTNAIAVIYNICDKNTFANIFEKNRFQQRFFFKKLMIWVFGSIVLLMTILHYVMETKFGAWITPALFILWGILSMLAPLNIYALYRLANKLPVIQASILQKTNLLLFSGLHIGIVVYGAIKAFITGILVYIHLCSLIAIVVMSIGVLITGLLEKKKAYN
jgi:hypothetical protein